jgi:hypothetical protein
MLNQTYSKTNFLKKDLDIVFDIDRLKSMSYKKDELYYTNNGELELKNEIIIESKNIFSIYTNDMYDLYLSISSYIKEVCTKYEIDINKQRYMIYGKISRYDLDTNKNWYDFPGINIPYLHGMYFPEDAEYQVSFNNNDSTIKEVFVKNQLFINKPTDIINIKTNKESEIIEFYIAPLYALKHNEPGVWVPIN